MFSVLSLSKKLLVSGILTCLLTSGCSELDRAPSSDISLYSPAKLEMSEVHTRIESESFNRLESARVVYANYALIKRDFPALKDLAESEIDKWLIKNAGFISKPNSKNQNANTKIAIEAGEETTGYRPPRYGRAAIFEASYEGEKVGLIDTKGIGHFLNARTGPKADGLATLGELLREVLFEKLMSLVLKDSGMNRNVVGSYAI